jgi:hypothetical protein
MTVGSRNFDLDSQWKRGRDADPGVGVEYPSPSRERPIEGAVKLEAAMEAALAFLMAAHKLQA